MARPAQSISLNHSYGFWMAGQLFTGYNTIERYGLTCGKSCAQAKLKAQSAPYKFNNTITKNRLCYNFLHTTVIFETHCHVSKYPPAKPGALLDWPLKAAGRVANAARRIRGRLKRPGGVADVTTGMPFPNPTLRLLR